MRTLFLLIVLFQLSSCKQKVSITTDQLQGQWVVTKALRNSKETKTLQSAFFKFSNDNSVNTNLLPNQENSTFTLNGNKLVIAGNEPIEFTINEFSNDSMKISGTINNFDLELELSKE